MRMVIPIAATAMLVASGAGCGGSDSSGDGTAGSSGSATTQTTAQSAGGASRLTVKMSEFAFSPAHAVAKAGKVTITAPNEGKVVHELVILKTDADPAHLPMKGDDVDESTNVGEVADVQPGTTKKVTLKLAAGKYAMVCALPGHYEAGMYGSLTVE